ncbi:hypothetical protein B0T20DRAFT_78471 [Sordaria brevicollis]|uniref:Uncharacterized protein n=1 Tax=Sordaria brevicollis TaxID=83679 RepID=A0AAE0P116_SORBR|nr:hypothetical protein B0T20DRAFT_78471 [Sordaria brevicollis]
MPPPAYVVGDSSPFLKRVLIPFWAVRIVIMVLELGGCGLLMAAIGLKKNDLDNDFGGKAVNTLIAIVAVDMALVFLCLVLDFVCIIKRSRRTLSPKFFFISNLIQTTIWVVFFILAMIGASSTVTIVLGIVIFLSFVGMLIYASVIFHQFRKGNLSPGGIIAGDGYVKTVNPAAGGPLGGGVYATGDTSYASQSYAAQAEPSAQKYSSPYSVGVTPVDNASNYASSAAPPYDAPAHGRQQQQGYELESRHP